MMRSDAHWLDFVEVISTEPLFCLKFPVTAVPGDTPMLPVARVVTSPSNVAAVPAMTANSEHSPRGISGALVAVAFDLRLVTSVLANAAMMVATRANATEKDLAMVGVWNEKELDCDCDCKMHSSFEQSSELRNLEI